MEDFSQYIWFLLYAIIVISIIIVIVWLFIQNENDRFNEKMQRHNAQSKAELARELQDHYAKLNANTPSQVRTSENQTQEREQKQLLRTSSPPQLDPVQELTRVYNKSVQLGDPSEFKQKYRNRLRIGVKNTEERLINPDVDPIFIDHDAGNYWGVEIKGRLYVVPRLELTFIETHNSPGAMSYVYRYGGFNVLMKYTGITVLEPALFTATANGYVLAKPGRIDLGKGTER